MQIHLVTGDVLYLCHVVGMGPAFAALAIVIRPPGGRGHVGFDVEHAPRVLEAHGLLAPEAALCRAAGDSGEVRPAVAPDGDQP